QQGHLERDEPLNCRSLERKWSSFSMAPPGQHRSPGCLTSFERLFSIMQASGTPPSTGTISPSKSNTLEVRTPEQSGLGERASGPQCFESTLTTRSRKAAASNTRFKSADGAFTLAIPAAFSLCV